jgi:hypothetical protein
MFLFNLRKKEEEEKENGGNLWVWERRNSFTDGFFIAVGNFLLFFIVYGKYRLPQ